MITGTVWIANNLSVPPTLTTADNLYAELATLVGIATPTIFAMPSSRTRPPALLELHHRRGQGLSVRQSTDLVGDRPVSPCHLGARRAPQSASAGTVCETIGIALVPTSVNFEWNGAEQAPPFNEPSVTISCTVSGGGSSSSAYAPASVAQARRKTPRFLRFSSSTGREHQ